MKPIVGLTFAAFSASFAVSALLVVGASDAVAQTPYTVVMTGLDNPRGLAFAPNGALWVTEAGRGGSGPCAMNAAGENRCYGNTGAVSQLWKGKQSRVAEGMPSHALPDGSDGRRSERHLVPG